jgi:hypothetical protein
MGHSRTPILTTLALVFVSLVYAADATGKWQASFDSGIGPQKYTYQFKVDGATLTGKADSGWGETEIQEGKISGDEISFVEIIDFAGNATRVTYKGKVSGDQIKFTRQVGEVGSEEFVAKRVK